MHKIEPYHRWSNYYDSTQDELSPFYEKEYNYDQYSETIYGYYIDPAWDFMGSETLYVKIIYANYEDHVAVIEFIGEWNDAINNDIMHFKRNVLDVLIFEGINKFILIGESVMNFHGSDDCYYEEWFDDIEDGWICAIDFQDHVLEEMSKYNIDTYLNYGGSLQISNWRTFKPELFCQLVESNVMKRLSI